MLAELIATDGVEELYRPGGPLGMMAIHGGLEEGTEGIAGDVAAATGSALYTVVQPKTLRWHVPSIRYDPAESEALAGYLESVRATVSLHGYGQPGLEGTALLGGTNRRLAAALGVELAARGISAIDDLESIPLRLRGVHRLNPVNRPQDGGVQIELPMELREGPRRQQVSAAIIATIEQAAAW